MRKVSKLGGEPQNSVSQKRTSVTYFASRWDDNDSKNADYILSQLHSAQPDVIIHGDA